MGLDGRVEIGYSSFAQTQKEHAVNDSAAKTIPPVYVSWGAFLNFINRLRDTGVPHRIDRSLMGSQSGSLISALIAGLKALNLIDDSQRPTETMKQLVAATDEARQPIYKQMFESAYSFVHQDQDFHLATATTAQLSQKFREQGMSGSTITKAIAFFLTLAKSADVKVSPHLKAPPAPRTNGKKPTKAAQKRDAEPDGEEQVYEESVDEDVERFEIPIPGKSSVRVIVPKDLDADDWEMLQSMITVYIKRWKGFKPGGTT
jgi:hypothetical protein